MGRPPKCLSLTLSQVLDCKRSARSQVVPRETPGVPAICWRGSDFHQCSRAAGPECDRSASVDGLVANGEPFLDGMSGNTR